MTGFCVIVCLMGVCICYQISFALMMTGLPDSFNPLSSWSVAEQTNYYIYLSALLVYPISCAKSVHFLSPVSFVALICLVLGLLVLVVFGYDKVYSVEDAVNNGIFQWPSWPDSISDGTSFLGIALYCYGLCVICFPIEESMQDKREFPKALIYSCIFVTVFYSLVGDVLSSIYRFDPNGVSQNILQNLPEASHAATAVRFVMAVVSAVDI
jgi:amino acid transporter